jgi:ABC-type nitrate/sulfonate/bicarbonate transport system permease component
VGAGAFAEAGEQHLSAPACAACSSASLRPWPAWRWAWHRPRGCRRLLLPPLEVLRPIPAVAWIPLAILMFPSSEMSMVFITFIGALFPILLNTVHGVEAVDPRLVASARSLGAVRLAIFTEVVLPGAAPRISLPACRSAWAPRGSAW